MNDLDLSGVAPMRWHEMRRRVAAVRNYLALERPSKSDHEDAARRIGLSIDQFDRLVRSWRIHSDPARLDGAGNLAPTRTRRERSDGLPEDVRNIIRLAIAEVGHDAAAKTVYDTVKHLCEESGFDVPSNNLVWTRLMETRSVAGAPAASGPEIVVGRIWLQLPVSRSFDGGELRRPELLVAVQLPEKRIVGHSSDFLLGRPPVFEDLAIDPPPEVPVRVAPRDMGSIDVADRKAVRPDRRANTRLARILGTSIGGLSIAFRLPRTPATKLLTNKLDSELTMVDAELAIDHAIRRHNEQLIADA